MALPLAHTFQFVTETGEKLQAQLELVNQIKAAIPGEKKNGRIEENPIRKQLQRAPGYRGMENFSEKNS